ncbi:MAG TPA: response regulator, partial [Gemmatimonadales bacterium]
YGAEAAKTAEGAADRVRRLLAGAPRAGVLLVEDDPSARPALGRVIRRAGYACLTAHDARQGLEFARARKPDLIITDYQMPGMNGLSFLRELRSDPALKEVPAIVLTGHVTSRLSRQFGGLSARLLSKPVESTALLSEIRRLI